MGDNADAWKNDIRRLLSELKTVESGLSSEEAASRLKEAGANTIPDKDRREWVDIFIAQFNSPLLLILIFASILAALMGEFFESGIILGITLISVFFSFFQEYKSEKTLSELKKFFRHYAIALRNKEKTEINAAELVPGDIVYVGMGDIVPADLRIIETDGISLNESVLTGESKEVHKSDIAALGSASTPQDIKNGLFMGTTVVNGYAKSVVVATGKSTFFGKTVGVFSLKVPESNFQIEIRKFGSVLVRAIFILTIAVFFANFLLGHGDTNPLAESALFALALAIGIAPEALPAVITIALSSGSLHLAKKKVIVKKLAAIEDLGNMDILCTDKTGTLTDGEEVMEKAVGLDGEESDEAFESALLCNAAIGSARIRGNPIDVAIKKKGLSRKIDLSGFSPISSIPFDFGRRRMGAVVSRGKWFQLIVKGAPESVLSVCSKARFNGKECSLKSKEKDIQKILDFYAEEGYTTIAVACKELTPTQSRKTLTPEDESGLVLQGFVLLSNPPKHSVAETVERLEKLNVRLKILTGDDPKVTAKLCSTLSLKQCKGRIILGSELSAMNEDEVAKIVENHDIFARITPEQKLLIIEALRKNGHVVGFLGDGINDAPALRTADVGISVDTAADVAKGASHIILLKKSLGVICDGIEDGRKIFGNITKYILNTMSANQGNMITVSISSFFLPFIPLLPSQILLNNLLSDVPLMTVSSDNVDKHYLSKPQRWNIDFIVRFMEFFGLISTIFDLLFIGVLYLLLNTDIATFRTAWFLESVLSEMLIVFSLRTRLPFFKSMPSHILVAASVGAMALSIGMIYFTPVASLFQFVPLSTDILLMTGVVLIGYFITTEIGKVFFFAREDAAAAKRKA